MKIIFTDLKRFNQKLMFKLGSKLFLKDFEMAVEGINTDKKIDLIIKEIEALFSTINKIKNNDEEFIKLLTKNNMTIMDTILICNKVITNTMYVGVIDMLRENNNGIISKSFPFEYNIFSKGLRNKKDMNDKVFIHVDKFKSKLKELNLEYDIIKDEGRLLDDINLLQNTIMNKRR